MSTHGSRSPDARRRDAADPHRPGGSWRRRPPREGGVSSVTVAFLVVGLLAIGFALGRWSAPVRTPERATQQQRNASGTPMHAAPRPTGRDTGGRVRVEPLAAGAGSASSALIQAQAPAPQQQAPGSPQELVPLPGGPGNQQGAGGSQGQQPAPGQGQAQGDCQLFMFRDGRMFRFSPGQQGLPGQQGAPGQQQGAPGQQPGAGQGNGGPFGFGGPQELYPLQPLPSPGQPSPGQPSPRGPSPFSPVPPSAPMPPPSMSQNLPAPGRVAWPEEPSSARPLPLAATTAA